jgi:hypothetical protein
MTSKDPESPPSTVLVHLVRNDLKAKTNVAGGGAVASKMRVSGA